MSGDDMPEVDGIKGVELIRQHAPNVLVIMQTVLEDEEKICPWSAFSPTI